MADCSTSLYIEWILGPRDPDSYRNSKPVSHYLNIHPIYPIESTIHNVMGIIPILSYCLFGVVFLKKIMRGVLSYKRHNHSRDNKPLVLFTPQPLF